MIFEKRVAISCEKISCRISRI